MLKRGVRVTGIKPELLLAIEEAREVYREEGYSFVITSLLDGRHQRNSLHYSGSAADLRLPGWPSPDLEAAQRIVTTLKHRLGQDYDVILEADHIHLEFDPEFVSGPEKTQA